MASTEPFARLLKVTGDAVAEVLDSYKQYYSHVVPSAYHQIIKNVKALLDLLQKLETEFHAGAFRTTPSRAKNNINEVLNECGQLAKLLHNRIETRNLRDDDNTSRSIQTCSAEIGFFLCTYGRYREEWSSGPPRAGRTEPEGLRHHYEESQIEIARLHNIIEEQAYRRQEDSYEASPSECYCEDRLLHIKRLHEAITCLGLRHPRHHGLDSWDELKGELPHMLDHIRGTNEQLKRLKEPESPTSTMSSRGSTTHRRNHSEPQNGRQTLYSTDFRPRPSSPTESNISISRESTLSNKSRKRRSKGTGYFSNQGG